MGEMSRLGFRIDHSRFVTSYGPIYHSVVFQRLKGHAPGR